jgi:hypothetical protein
MPGYGNNAIFLQTLQGLGVPLQTAIGAMGSLGWESGVHLDNKARNAGDGADGSDSIGWGQWNGPRARNLMATGQQMGLDWHDPRAQAAHIRNELTGPYSHVLDALKRANSVGAGADIWTRSYEVPKIVNSGDRANRGVQIASAMGLPVDASASYPSNLQAMASTAGASTSGSSPTGLMAGQAPVVDPASVGGMLAGAVAPWSPPPVAPVPGVDLAGLSGIAGTASVGSSGLSGGDSGGFAPDSMEDPYGDKALQTELAGLAQLPEAGVPADQLGARYAKAKAAGGPVGDSSSLADLFKLKDIGQSKSLRKPSQTV